MTVSNLYLVNAAGVRPASATKSVRIASYAAQQRMTGNRAEVRRHEQSAEHRAST